MQSPHEQYAIVSVCGSVGTLHVHRPRDATPRHTQTLCHSRRFDASVLTKDTLISISQPPNSNTATLVHHLLSRPAGAPSRRTALPEHLNALALSSSHTLLAAAADSGRLFVWHLPSGILLTSFSVDISTISTLTFSDDSDSLVIATADASIAIFSTAALVDTSRPSIDDPPPISRLFGHTLPPTSLVAGVAGASARLVSISPDRSLRVWHVASARCTGTVLFDVPPLSLALTHDESFSLVGLADGRIVSVPIASLPCGQTRTASRMLCANAAEGIPVRAMTLSPKETEVVVGYDDGVIRILHAATLAVLHIYSKHSVAAPINVIRTIPEIPQGASDPVPLQRAQDNNLADEFTPIVQVSGLERDIVDDIWEGIDHMEHTVYGEWVTANDKGEYQKTDVVESGSSMAGELMSEIDALKLRNKQLEDAGKRVLDLLKQNGWTV